MTRSQCKTTSRNATVRAVALFPIARHFAQRRSFQGILAGHGIHPQDIRDSYGLIPLTAFMSILEEAAKLSGDPVFGARLGTTIAPGDLGPAGLLMAQSATLRRGLTRYAESISSLQGATEMRLSESDGQMDFSYQLVIGHPAQWPQDAEMSLASTCNMIRTCFGARWHPEEVHFAHGESERSDLLEAIYRAPVRFGQATNRIVFSVANVDRHVRSEDRALLAMVERHIADLVQGSRDRHEDFAALTRAAVTRRLGRSPCSVTIIAAELGVTSRTLQRNLARQNTSFRDILCEKRKEIASIQLEGGGKTLSDVAWSMGYSDGTVFWRAYKRWTGYAPSSLRTDRSARPVIRN